MIIPENSIEDKSLRTRTSKHFPKGDNVIVGKFGVGDEHYYNKFGVGDGIGGWRELDWTLVPKEEGGWTFLFHSFNPDVPQYADGWLGFRDLFEDKDQKIEFKAVSSHVEGRLISKENIEIEGLKDLTDANAVIYDNAFGEGKDYIVYFTNSQMKKCARIKSSSKEIRDYSFDWELRLPEGSSIWRVDNNGEYELDLSISKDFDTDKHTEIRTEKGITFFRPFFVWDSNKDFEVCRVSYIKDENGRFFLRKHVTADFMSKSSGDVFTDTTTSYNAGAGDGDVYADLNGWTWANVRGESAGQVARPTQISDGLTQCDSRSSGTRKIIRRGYFPIDTSGITSANVVTSASMNFYVSLNDNTTGSGTENYICLSQESQDSNTTLVVNDYPLASTSLNSPTRGATDIFQTSITLNAYLTINLNATGISWVSTTGFTKLGFRGGHDVDNVFPPIDTYTEISTSFSESTTNKPFLSATYSPKPKVFGSILLMLT